ncbi:class I poly(R)-hydroxyalkanoic acid synthase [Chitiniphilus purpureus]|uniref:Class I poly(R)-hydroxyalkanoic acid synthase n=1 Tax=Chitiniphilus purpureus TaxID=2981137 RepID=A0ABY6DL40_9NEIS|nr:class I poly(R)-hydroxyalkanoic acid synthase [Chitiniphilus sp. CD1]UXY14423.1 class I poly(R)-hydroxyalkanoic acid synthase [Chitiniphilus sp. CD1]
MFNPPSFDALLQQLNEAQRQWWQQWAQAGVASGGATAPVSGGAAWPAWPGTDPEWLSRQTDFYRAQLDLWLGLVGAKAPARLIEPEKGDRRFNAPEWEEPLFSFIKQNYLLTAKWLMDSVSAAASDEATREKLAFFTRQYIDAISPANFALTNPEVLKLAAETNGESLADGMKKLLADVQKGSITMTDEREFEVGRNLAVTPGTVVFENELFQLLQYTPSTGQVFETPLLIVPPCVNKYYIMDLQPENSMVRWIVEQGYTTFLVSWRSIPPELGKLKWDDYVADGVIQAAEVVREIIRRDKMNVLSFCIGGELLATAIPVMQARGLDWFESLTLMTVMLDHTDPGDIKHFIDWNVVRTREPMLESGGVISGKELARTFSALRANDLIWNYVVNNYLKGQTPPPFDLLYWNNDSANLALPMHTFFLENMYLNNNLVKPGSFSLCGVPIDLTRIDLPSYVFAAREDHIVPWRSAYGTTRLFRGPLRFVLGASGHIAGTINPVSANKRNYWVNDALPEAPEQWFEAAQSRPGSWWQDWHDWLAPRSGKLVAAPKKPGSKQHAPIEPAPGRYVKARLD